MGLRPCSLSPVHLTHYVDDIIHHNIIQSLCHVVSIVLFHEITWFQLKINLQIITVPKFSKVNPKDNQFQHSPRVRMVTRRHTHSTGASGHMRAGEGTTEKPPGRTACRYRCSHDSIGGKAKGGKTRAVNPSYNFTKERFVTELNISTLQSDLLKENFSYTLIFQRDASSLHSSQEVFQSLCWHYTLGKGVSHWEPILISNITIASFLNKTSDGGTMSFCTQVGFLRPTSL